MTEEPWYRSDPASLGDAVGEALAVQPALELHDEGTRVILRGRYDIREEGEVIESFALEIELPSDSPRGLPKVWEIGGRIPRVADPHHVNVGDGTLCVLLPEAFWLEHPSGRSLSEYLEDPLRTHLAGQSLVLRGHDWPAGEWRHGSGGIFQFYIELFGTTEAQQLREFFELLVRDRVKGHWGCPCGSGKKLRHCHGPQVYRVRENLPQHLLDPLRIFADSNTRRAS